MTRSCRLCGGQIKRSLTGRPRVFCVTCAPPGAKHPRKDFPRVSRTQSQRVRGAARSASRSAAYRRLRDAHPDEYAQALADELAQRLPEAS